MRSINPFWFDAEMYEFRFVSTEWSDTHSTGWYFFDETGDWHGPYQFKFTAKRALKKYAYHLEHGPTFMQRVWAHFWKGE